MLASGKIQSILLSACLLDTELHGGVDCKPPLAIHVALVALGIHIGFVGSSREVVDTRIEDLEDISVADAAKTH